MRDKPRVVYAPDIEEINVQMFELVEEIVVALRPIIQKNSRNFFINALMLTLINLSAVYAKSQEDIDEMAEALCEAIRGNCKGINFDEENQ